MALPKYEILGKKFGRLTVKAYFGKSKWECICECGNKTNVLSHDLNRGHTKSCGCGEQEARGKSNITHGLSHKIPEYSVWARMKRRCYNKNDKSYPDYGGRGIIVCDRWKGSFENFYADMGIRPSPKHSIERRDVNGIYEPNNCHWDTKEEQNNNTRVVLKFEYNGKIKTISQWAKEYGIGRRLLEDRLYKKWPIEKALKMPKISNQYAHKEYAHLFIKPLTNFIPHAFGVLNT